MIILLILMSRFKFVIAFLGVVLLTIPANRVVNNVRGYFFSHQLNRVITHESISLIEHSNIIKAHQFQKGCLFVGKGIFIADPTKVNMDAIRLGLKANSISQPFPSREQVTIKSVNEIEDLQSDSEDRDFMRLEYVIVSKRFSPWLDIRCWRF